MGPAHTRQAGHYAQILTAHRASVVSPGCQPVEAPPRLILRLAQHWSFFTLFLCGQDRFTRRREIQPCNITGVTAVRKSQLEQDLEGTCSTHPCLRPMFAKD